MLVIDLGVVFDQGVYSESPEVIDGLSLVVEPGWLLHAAMHHVVYLLQHFCDHTPSEEVLV